MFELNGLAIAVEPSTIFIIKVIPEESSPHA